MKRNGSAKKKVDGVYFLWGKIRLKKFGVADDPKIAESSTKYHLPSAAPKNPDAQNSRK